MDTDLDSELEAVINDIEAAGVPAWHALSVESARRVEEEVFTAANPPTVNFVRDVAFAGPVGEVPVRVYRHEADTPAPTLVFYHGGGWTLGTLDSIDGFCRTLARRTGCVVISVDYHRAPEHPFPIPVEDARAALRWVADHAPAFGGDPDRLGVAGTSSGANLAAAVALSVREDAPPLRQQVLLYPILNYAFDTDSYAENANAPLLTRADMEWFWEQYLRSPVDGHNPFASPLRAPDHSGIAPATIVTAGFDPLRDEGIAYADALADAGVTVNHDHYPSMVHGFLSVTDSVARADEAVDDLAATIREQFELGH
jgi:acetyl esterase